MSPAAPRSRSCLDPLGPARLRAYARDALGYLGIAVATVPIGALVSRLEPGYGAVLAMSAAPPVLATLWAARAESGPARSTWGKRREHLAVQRPDAGALSFPRALLRNSLKIAIPWQLGHAVALGAAFGGFDRMDPLTLTASALTYPVIGIGLATVLLRPGRTPYDRASGSLVIRSTAAAR